MRLFPPWMHPFVSRLLPSYWYCRSYIRSAKRTLGPKFRGLLSESNSGPKRSPDPEQHYNALTWLADLAKGKDRDPAALSFVEVLLALASVHSTLIREVNVLYDLVANPEYIEELREEIHSTSLSGWKYSSYHDLQKLDSVLRESQRMSPPTVTGLKRLFKESHTFSNGLHIPQGTYVCVPVFAIENDPEITPNPQKFDGLRSYRLRQRENEKEDHQFSTPEKTVLGFGYGRTACPGRFFASLMIKMTFVKILTEYDFKFLPHQGRPRMVGFHEYLFPLPWVKVLVRRRECGVCPF